MSTSQDAVFELRNLENARMLGRKTNLFIEIPKTKRELEESLPQKIKPTMEPWQLKSIYKVVDK